MTGKNFYIPVFSNKTSTQQKTNHTRQVRYSIIISTQTINQDTKQETILMATAAVQIREHMKTGLQPQKLRGRLMQLANLYIISS
jgi:hypothetical protein